jgi:transposase
LETEAIVAAEVKPADEGDAQSGPQTLGSAADNLAQSGSASAIQECVADKGYHDAGLIAQLTQEGIRTYIPERRQRVRRWEDKPQGYEVAFRGNRRRVSGDRGRQLSRWRSERCERSFAHVCETGGGRRAWVRGLAEVAKLHWLRCAAHNLGLLLRKVYGMIKPRGMKAVGAAFAGLFALFCLVSVTVLEPTGWILGAILLIGLLHIVVSRAPPYLLLKRELLTAGSLTAC